MGNKGFRNGEKKKKREKWSSYEEKWTGAARKEIEHTRGKKSRMEEKTGCGIRATKGLSGL